MYARGMTVREIQGFLAEMYSVDVSPDLISRVTDEVMSEVTAWQTRPLEPMYPVVFFDALRVKIREDAVVRSKAVYLALGVLPDGTRDILGVWIEQTDKPFKDHDANWSAFQDYQRELIEYDPDSALDLVVAVLKVETNPFLLSVLAAGLLEDVIDMPVMDRIEREAAADPRFLALLGGVWYSRKPDDVKARLDSIIGPRHIV